jgi:hypothetical protein
MSYFFSKYEENFPLYQLDYLDPKIPAVSLQVKKTLFGPQRKPSSRFFLRKKHQSFFYNYLNRRKSP